MGVVGAFKFIAGIIGLSQREYLVHSSVPNTPIWSIVLIVVYVAMMAAFVKEAPGSEEELEMEQAAVMAPAPAVEETTTYA